MEHKFILTDHQETGWQAITDRINAQREKNDLPPQTIDDVILEQLTTTGDREAIRAAKAAKPMTEINTIDEAVAKLAAMGYQVQAPR
jgi:hypothetical protein